MEKINKLIVEFHGVLGNPNRAAILFALAFADTAMDSTQLRAKAGNLFNKKILPPPTFHMSIQMLLDWGLIIREGDVRSNRSFKYRLSELGLLAIDSYRRVEKIVPKIMEARRKSMEAKLLEGY